MAREFAKSFYKSQEWKACREYVLMRDRYLCVRCGRPAEEVHHKIRLNESNIFNPSIALNPSNLISLCRDCHFAEHKEERINAMRKKDNVLPEYEFDENGMIVERQISPLF